MTIRSEPAAEAPFAAGFPANAVERALSAAAKDRTRVGELLDELAGSRLWLPLPDDGGPVTDGHALTLPTVRYLDDDFVPAFTSASLLKAVLGADGTRDLGSAPDDAGTQDPPGGEVPHAVVPVAELARLLPAGLGIVLNPGAAVSVPIYPDDIVYLASTHTFAGDSRISLGRPPTEPTRLLSAVAAGLRGVGAAKSATRAWLTTDAGQGLVISVALDDPADGTAQQAVLDTVADAVDITGPPFPVDVAFPGEYEPGPLEHWTAANAPPFFLRP
jgi:SseB protein N-terminal domain/SseB protein C-terminal domain